MTKVQDPEKPKIQRQQAPAATPEGRENQLITLAIDLAEKQLKDGTASAQVITHFLKLGSTSERAEKEMLEEQKKLVNAKTKAFLSADELKIMYANALQAMQTYSGNNGDNYD